MKSIYIHILFSLIKDYEGLADLTILYINESCEKQRNLILNDIINEVEELIGEELERRCEVCGSSLRILAKYDSEFCPECGEWRNDLCSDPQCGFCTTRPKGNELIEQIKKRFPRFQEIDA